jgi:hypothetical protein
MELTNRTRPSGRTEWGRSCAACSAERERPRSDRLAGHKPAPLRPSLTKVPSAQTPPPPTWNRPNRTEPSGRTERGRSCVACSAERERPRSGRLAGHKPAPLRPSLTKVQSTQTPPPPTSNRQNRTGLSGRTERGRSCVACSAERERPRSGRLAGHKPEPFRPSLTKVPSAQTPPSPTSNRQNRTGLSGRTERGRSCVAYSAERERPRSVRLAGHKPAPAWLGTGGATQTVTNQRPNTNPHPANMESTQPMNRPLTYPATTPTSHP